MTVAEKKRVLAEYNARHPDRPGKQVRGPYHDPRSELPYFVVPHEDGSATAYYPDGNPNQAVDDRLGEIARRVLRLDTLLPHGRDALDFCPDGVESVRPHTRGRPGHGPAVPGRVGRRPVGAGGRGARRGLVVGGAGGRVPRPAALPGRVCQPLTHRGPGLRPGVVLDTTPARSTTDSSDRKIRARGEATDLLLAVPRRHRSA